MRKTLTQKGVLTLRPKAKIYTVGDPECRGHMVRIMTSGAKSFLVVTRDPYGKQIWHTIGAADVLDIDDARDKARVAIKRIKEGKPPVEPPPVKPDTFQAVAEDWLKRHVIKKQLRTEREIKRSLEKYVYPKWADRDFIDIKRSDITALLDHIEDEHGSRMADMVLAFVRSIANWYASRHDDFVSPFVRGMRRTDPKERARSRKLNDDELRLIWKAAEDDSFGALIRLLLLTAQRREKVATMKWADIANGVWTIDTAEREKGNAGVLALPAQALAIINAQPKMGDNPYVFAGRGLGSRDFSQSKPSFDRKLPKMPRWTLHDLRRTSRSLLSRAGVSSEHSERLLGHAITGVEGTYDRHPYDDEKADALKRLAALIETILHPRSDNVTPMKRARR